MLSPVGCVADAGFFLLPRVTAHTQIHNPDPSRILVDVIDTDASYAFVMCNPPFFAENYEPCQRTQARPPPQTPSTASLSELETDVCMYVNMSVRMSVCMYVCTNVCIGVL